MSILDRVQSRIRRSSESPQISTAHVLLFLVLLFAVVTRFWRLGDANGCYFDEVYFPTTGAEILRGDNRAWDFYGHENTHPPLSKEIMAIGMGIFGKQSSHHPSLECWGDAEDADKKDNPDWAYKPVGWRFFGALAGVGAVFFMYLLGRRLFNSEVAGLASAAFLAMDGVALAQARIATPDTYVLFFTLGALYFLVTDRFLLSGLLFGAASATKWIGAFTLGPIVLYLIFRLVKGIIETEPDERMKEVERVLLAGAAMLGVTALVGFFAGILSVAGVLGGFADIATVMAFPLVPALAIIVVGLIFVLANKEFRSAARGRLYLETAAAFPLFFLMVPLLVYVATYIPMLANGHSHGFFDPNDAINLRIADFFGLGDAWELNKSAYLFHSQLESPHGYASDWYEWPIMREGIYMFVQPAPENQDGTQKIYSFGNVAVFWMALPALGFLLWRALSLRTRLADAAGGIRVLGRLDLARWPMLFVALSYLLTWLPWATQPRVLFIYHYLPALSFAILALGYSVHWLWHTNRDWGRWAAMGTLALAGVTFLYFYPHWTGYDVSRAVEESYYWFDTWR
jgi:dolichyl-phosphate-mannose--protein O-mannosyl transferase